jgi:hypothetical protein
MLTASSGGSGGAFCTTPFRPSEAPRTPNWIPRRGSLIGAYHATLCMSSRYVPDDVTIYLTAPYLRLSLGQSGGGLDKLARPLFNLIARTVRRWSAICAALGRSHAWSRRVAI